MILKQKLVLYQNYMIQSQWKEMLPRSQTK